MKLIKNISILLFTFIILYLYNYRQTSVFKIKDVKIESSKIKQMIKITQISDLHSNKKINFEKLNSEIKIFNPDIIVLTGDIISRDDNNLDVVLHFLESLVEIKKNIFYIKGNHERGNLIYETLKEKMEQLEIVVLEDETREITINNEILNITGLDFFKKSEEKKEIKSYLEVIKDIDMDRYNIVLRHSPTDVENILSGNEDLILSGHTHGGQVRLPFIGSVVVPGQGFFPKYDKGLFFIDDTALYIDSGIGYSTIPVRLFNRIQFSNITISTN